MSHPLLYHRAALALCRRTGFEGDWRDLCVRERWDYSARLRTDVPLADYANGRELPLQKIVEPDHRKPPLPFYNAGPDDGVCRVCGQPVYAGRTWYPRPGKARKGSWHWLCFEAYNAWVAPRSMLEWLAIRQGGRCAYSGDVIAERVELGPQHWKRHNPYHSDDPRWRLFKPPTHAWRLVGIVEADHLVPLWRVPQLMASWPRVLDFWGAPNLRAATGEAHRQKTRREAGERARRRREDWASGQLV